MRILYASERPPYPFFLGGAARSSYQLLSMLSTQYKLECTAVGSMDFSTTSWGYPDPVDYQALGVKSVSSECDPPIIDCGYPVEVLTDFYSTLEHKLDIYKPDIVWAQMEGAKKIFQIARSKGIRCLYFVRDAEFNNREMEDIADLGVHFICNSHFLAAKVKQVTGKSAAVVYPSLDVSYEVKGDPGGYITMINPHKVKGIDAFLNIAEKLPDEKFLILESWKLDDQSLLELQQKLKKLPHVRFERRTANMGSIYKQTKLLLVPSVWEEAFGRVVIEAQSCQIPVIASLRGGLAEAVGRGGVLIKDFQNDETWVEEIRKILQDKTLYKNLSEEANQHISNGSFSVSTSAKLFFNICSNIVSQKNWFPREKIKIAKILRQVRRQFSKYP